MIDLRIANMVLPKELLGIGNITEATVVRCKNGLAINYTEVYMPRRDLDCMIIADNGDTDKPRCATY